MELKRWIIANKLYAGLFILMALFAIMDIYQIKAFFILDTPQAWTLYNTYTGPAIWTMWYVIILIIGFVYYLFTKDKSETAGLIVAGLILLLTGVEDVMYFMFGDQPMTPCMQWFNDLGHPVSYWASLWGQSCVSPLALISFSILGIFVSYKIFNKLKRARW